MNNVFRVKPQLFPLFIKPLFLLLEKQKNNWLSIKILKLFDKMIELEPRLLKKMSEPLNRMLRQTTAKSIEFELISIIIHHFREFNELYALACDNLKNFINHSDANCKKNSILKF